MTKQLPKGFKEFLIKSAIFIGLFVLIQLLTMGLVAKTTLPGNLKFLAMDDLAEAVLFVLVIFIGLNRTKILKIGSYGNEIKTKIISMILILIGFIVYFKYKYFLLNNLVLTTKYIYLLTALEYLLLLLILFFLAGLVFGFKFIRDFFSENKRGLLYSLVGVIFVYLAVREFQGLWFYLSNFVGSSVNYLLNFFGPSTIYQMNNIPVLEFNNFIVGIAKTCSGIDSILLFTGLYIGILAWDWKILNKRKALILYFVGVIGAFILNIIRIFLLILFGAYVSRDFALNAFHTNAASVFFLIYFAIFWKISYKWMKK